jgi:simple sugar transport system permease protein
MLPRLVPRLQPLGVVLAAHLLALILIGGENVQMMGVPSSVAQLFHEVLLMALLASDVLVRFRVVWGTPTRGTA